MSLSQWAPTLKIRNVLSEGRGATNRGTACHIPEEPNSIYVLLHSSLNFTKKGLELSRYRTSPQFRTDTDEFTGTSKGKWKEDLTHVTSRISTYRYMKNEKCRHVRRETSGDRKINRL